VYYDIVDKTKKNERENESNWHLFNKN